MLGFIDAVLKFFGFVEHQYTIALVCLLVFLLNFAGGLLRSMVLAFGPPIKERRIRDQISFRLCMATVLVLIVYALYYHGVLIEDIETGHVIYWVFSVLAAPLLGVIGSEITGIIFGKMIERKKAEFRKWEAAERAKKFAAAEKRKAGRRR